MTQANRPSFSILATLGRLRADTTANTLALVAAAILPLLALVGGSVDIGRGYLAESRLQQACDAGVLAARKRLGAVGDEDGDIPTEVAELGQRFFNINFRKGSYGTKDRSFVMTLESDYAISGVANVVVPTAVMNVFGQDKIDVAVACEAQLNASNTDIMMVLDVTGSMGWTNPGDINNRITTLRDTVKTFYGLIGSTSSKGSRVRFGFVPYSANVNVGHLLEDDWVDTSWKYQSRKWEPVGTTETMETTQSSYTVESGTESEWTTISTHDATWVSTTGGSSGSGSGSSTSGGTTSTWWTVEGTSSTTTTTTTSSGGSTTTSSSSTTTTSGGSSGGSTTTTTTTTSGGTSGGSGSGGSSTSGGGGSGYWSCNAAPSNTYNSTVEQISETSEPYAGPPAGTQTTKEVRLTETGDLYRVTLTGETCEVQRKTYQNQVSTFTETTRPIEYTTYQWHYKQWQIDADDWRTTTDGCIEERETYEITDYDNVNLNSALDLDLNRVPDGNPNTKWKPLLPEQVFARSIKIDGTGDFEDKPQKTLDDYVSPNDLLLSPCPAPAQKLQEMTAEELDTYLGNLLPAGQTYHDIGMIWGGRLISQTGLFASENADANANQPTSRHLIFLTDGETAPLDLTYASYGLEPLDKRRWDKSSSLTLKQTIENRFSFACEEVKKMNVTVWVVAFGTTLNPVFQECSGAERYYEAANADALNKAFADIANSLAELRITD